MPNILDCECLDGECEACRQEHVEKMKAALTLARKEGRHD